MVPQRVRSVLLAQLHRFTIFAVGSSDYFGLYKTFAALFAIHYHARNWIDWALWNVYRLLPILVNVSYFYKAYRLLMHQEEDNTAAAAVVASVWGFTEASMRIVLIEVRYGALSTIMRFLNDRTYRCEDARVHRQRATRFVQNNRTVLLLVGTMLLEAIWFMTTMLLSRDAFMLQLNGKVVPNATVQITYGLLSNIWGMIYVLTFGILYIIMNTFEMEMGILLEAITNLKLILVQRQRALLMRRQTSHAHTPREEQKIFWMVLQQELKRHISRHVDLLDNLKELSLIVGPFSFVQYYGTFALIADCGFILSIEGLSANGLIYILFAMVLVFESYLICRGIEKINDLNEAVGQALYMEFDWPGLLRYSEGFRNQYRSVRHSLLLVIGRSQKGFQCSYGGLGGISMERFAQLMQKSYSLLTILLQFAK